MSMGFLSKGRHVLLDIVGWKEEQDFSADDLLALMRDVAEAAGVNVVHEHLVHFDGSVSPKGFASVLLIDEIDVERIRSHAAAIHATDRWSSYDRYHETADYVLGLMLDNKLRDLRKITTPADGKTVVGDWLMPLAWDARAGTATISAPSEYQGKVLADYLVEPNHLVRWSSPTPPGGITADLVDVGDGARPKAYAGIDVGGKIVLINGYGGEAKALAVEHGAADGVDVV